MYKLSCANMGLDCDFEADGETIEEVMSEMLDHAIEYHQEMMDVLTVEEKRRVISRINKAIEMA